ncbi:MAG: hypothetical protein WBV89_03535, partial [Ilumatobacter sp.]
MQCELTLADRLKEVDVRQRLDERSDEFSADDPPRPDSPPGAIDRVREWIEWFGLVRLVTSAIAVVVVCAGAWFLVRSPPPPSEASLPMATSAGGGSSTVAPSSVPAAITTTTDAGPV